MTEDDIEKLVTDYAHEHWAADRTISRRQDAECDAAMDRIMGQIKAKLAEGETDTKRLDWLEKRKYACIGINFHEGQWVYQIETDGYAERGKTLRTAIDAARADKST